MRRLLRRTRTAYAGLGSRSWKAQRNMQRRVPAGLAAIVGLALLCAPAAGHAASFNCRARDLGETKSAICHDGQLSRVDEQIARRVSGLARRLTFGQYLGLRHWHSGWGETRESCGSERTCLGASYRAQGRFLDRLQQCLDAGFQRRSCLRNTLNIEREAVRR
jgi:uncharacterized protein